MADHAAAWSSALVLRLSRPSASWIGVRSRLVALAALALVACTGDGGGTADIRAARIVAGATPVLEADLELALTPTMREALDRGIALDLEFRLEGRDGPQRLEDRRRLRLRFLPIANQYQELDVATGTSRQFASRAQLFAALDQVRLTLDPAWAAYATQGDLRLELTLERSALPGSLRLPALFATDWHFRAAEHRWHAGG